MPTVPINKCLEKLPVLSLEAPLFPTLSANRPIFGMGLFAGKNVGMAGFTL